MSTSTTATWAELYILAASTLVGLVGLGTVVLDPSPIVVGLAMVGHALIASIVATVVARASKRGRR